ALAATWGASYLFIRVAAPELGPLPLAAARVGLAALVLWVSLGMRGHRLTLRPYAGRLLVLGALNAALPYSLLAAAELHVTASLAAMLGATQALWGALFGAIWLGERVTARAGAGLLLGVAGVGVLVGLGPVTASAST